MENPTDKPLSQTFGIPAAREGSVKNNESEILLLKRRTNELFSILGGGAASLFPPGLVTMFAGETPPGAWLLCDGSAVSREDYPGLFEAIGVSYGSGDGSTTFNLPNFQQRFPRGASDAASVAQLGGESSHLHAVTVADGSNAHTHSFSMSDSGGTSSAGGHYHSVSVGNGGSGTTSNSGSHAHSSTTNSGGGGDTGQPSSTFLGRTTGSLSVVSNFHTHTIPTHSHTMNNPSAGLHNHDVFNHSHGASSGSNGDHSHSFSVSDSGTTGAASVATHSHTASSATQDHLPPYVTINFIIKT